MFLWEWPNVLHLKEMQMSDCAAKAGQMWDTEYHQPKVHTVQLPTLGQGQLSIGKVQKICSNFYKSSANASVEQGV